MKRVVTLDVKDYEELQGLLADLDKALIALRAKLKTADKGAKGYQYDAHIAARRIRKRLEKYEPDLIDYL